MKLSNFSATFYSLTTFLLGLKGVHLIKWEVSHGTISPAKAAYLRESSGTGSLQTCPHDPLMMEPVERTHSLRKACLYYVVHTLREVESNLFHAHSQRFWYLHQCLYDILCKRTPACFYCAMLSTRFCKCPPLMRLVFFSPKAFASILSMRNL